MIISPRFLGTMTNAHRPTVWYDTLSNPQIAPLTFAWTGQVVYDNWIANTSGTVTRMRVFNGNESPSGILPVKIALYDDYQSIISSGISTDALTSSGWLEINVSPSVNIISGITYIIGVRGHDNFGVVQLASNSQSASWPISYEDFPPYFAALNYSGPFTHGFGLRILKS